MVMLARLDDVASAADRRGSYRRTLRLNVEPAASASIGSVVTIHDLSLTGALIETSATLAVDELFQVQLPESGTVEASVVWNSGEFYGCQFRQPISPAQLSAAILRGSPPRSEITSSADDPLSQIREVRSQVESLLEKVDQAIEELRNR